MSDLLEIMETLDKHSILIYVAEVGLLYPSLHMFLNFTFSSERLFTNIPWHNDKETVNISIWDITF
jgi:hypothetical protein